jgi:hypothetical protein
MSNSVTAKAINIDGSWCLEGDLCDEVTIGFGTGKVKGQFVRDKMCLEHSSSCIEVNAVVGVEMSNHPFQSFGFDGILGLGLQQLSIASEFNFLNRLMDLGSFPNYQFGFFLTHGTQSLSEIAMGGYNKKRLLTPLSWAPVAKDSLGHWLVKITEVKIAGRTLDVCKDGSCQGIVDTGSSHLGIPSSSFDEFMNKLSVDSGGAARCAEVHAPEVELVLEGFGLMLAPRHYMRPLPVEKSVVFDSRAVSPMSSVDNESTNEVPALPAAAALAANASNANVTSMSCTPRLASLNFPEPLGPNFFILGEPVLHRYYTVFDWKERAIGFGLSDTAQNRHALQASRGVEQGLPEDQVILVQVFLSVRVRRS